MGSPPVMYTHQTALQPVTLSLPTMPVTTVHVTIVHVTTVHVTTNLYCKPGDNGDKI